MKGNDMTIWNFLKEAPAGTGTQILIIDDHGEATTFVTSEDVKVGDKVSVTIDGIDVSGVVEEIF